MWILSLKKRLLKARSTWEASQWWLQEQTNTFFCKYLARCRQIPLPCHSGSPAWPENYRVKSWVRAPTIGTICIWFFLCPEHKALSKQTLSAQRNSLYQGSNLWAFHPAKHTHSPCGKQPGSPFIPNREPISLYWNYDRCGLMPHSTNPFIKV